MDKENQTVNCNKKKCGGRRWRGAEEGGAWDRAGEGRLVKLVVKECEGVDKQIQTVMMMK